MKGAIAIPDWEACGTCKNFGANGCDLPDIDLELHLGDWILCEQCEEKDEKTE